jgi:hypothetical protein
MADTKETTTKTIKPRKKKAPPQPPACWEICRECLFDTDDSVHICLGDLFVTRAELERMMASNPQTPETQR